MNEVVRQFLFDYLRDHRAEVVARATDWVVGESRDLQGKRPREETQRLVEKVVGWNEALILRADSAPLSEFIGFVTTYRAASEFHISTLLRGFCSFRAAMAELLAPPQVDAELAFHSLRVVEDAYHTAIFQMSDEYVGKLNQTLVKRRQQLEEDLAKVAEQHQREFQEAMALIHRQQELLHQVSLPMIRVFQGVLVLPVIGELTAERAQELIQRLLEAIVSNRVRTVILELTGLPTVNQIAAAALIKAGRAVRLIGARLMLVGISAQTAAALAMQSLDDELPQSFSTLADGLRVALRQQGLEVQRTQTKQ